MLFRSATSRDDRCLGDAVMSAPDASEHIRSLLRGVRTGDFTSERLLNRFEQFVTEAYDIIPKASDAFAGADLRAIGEQVARSQHGVERLLGNQIPETIALVRQALALHADAASAFGAGFGGSVWALVARERADAFATDWLEAYRTEFPAAAARAEMIVTVPGPGAMQL